MKDKEIRFLALQFDPSDEYPEYYMLNEKGHIERTKDFMRVGDKLKELRNEIDLLLKTINNAEGFTTLIDPEKRKIPNSEIKDLRRKIEEWSCETIFKNVLVKAQQVLGRYDRQRETGKLPNVYAAAWLSYFAEWDEVERQWNPNQNWKKYYKEFYPIAREKENDEDE